YYLAESRFNDRNWLLAASEYERYTNSFPDSPRREEVDFKIATCYYNLSPRHNIDQSHTRSAIERYRLFLARYPNSEQFDVADSRITEMRNKLARKSYDAAQFYMRNDMYEAATVYFDIAIDSYPETIWAERSLAAQIEAYI
ncbi:outer membrane protein assembly factor BamD, partial [Acinetobacter baumannii]|uniref:outer membrane protein assembly factor BamD n=1 Tax=Acinetobacter baumannii TaxID=470 RepID=UPI0018992323